MAGSQVTTLDIATKLGVGRSTVINVLNRSQRKRYSKELCKKVMDTAGDLGYLTGLMAKSVKQSLRHIAFLGSGIANFRVSFMREIVDGIQDVAGADGYLVMVTEPGRELVDADELQQEWNKKTENLIKLLSSRVLDGLIIDDAHFGNNQKQILDDSKVPMVLINGSLPEQIEVDRHRQKHIQRNWVCIDHVGAGRMAAEYLLAYGHRNIAVISPASPKFTSPKYYLTFLYSSCVAGFNLKMGEAGLGKVRVFEASLGNRKAILKAIEEIISLSELPTAIFICNDDMAVFALHYLRSKGIKVPEDISIIGYGNLPVCDLAVPKLTTVNVPWVDMGKLGTQMLLSLLQNKKEHENIHDHHITLRTRIVEGETIAEPTRK